ADAQVRKQVEALEDHAHVLAQRAHRAGVAVQQRLAVDAERAFLEGLEAVDAAKQRALARAALADDRNHLARLDGEVDALEHLVCAEALAQALDLNDGHAGSFPACGSRPKSDSTGRSTS